MKLDKYRKWITNSAGYRRISSLIYSRYEEMSTFSTTDWYDAKSPRPEHDNSKSLLFLHIRGYGKYKKYTWEIFHFSTRPATKTTCQGRVACLCSENWIMYPLLLCHLALPKVQVLSKHFKRVNQRMCPLKWTQQKIMQK